MLPCVTAPDLAGFDWPAARPAGWITWRVARRDDTTAALLPSWPRTRTTRALRATAPRTRSPRSARPLW